MLQYDLKTEEKTNNTKTYIKELRRQHRIPCVMYGHKEDTKTFSVKESDLLKMLHTIGRENAIINIKIGDYEKSTIIKEIQKNPRTNAISHIDFLILHKGEKIKVNVPLKIKGTAEGIKEGGVLEQLMREIEIKCIPSKIPEHFEIDISALKIGDSIHISDIEFKDGEFITNTDETLVTIIAPRTVKAEEETAEETEEATEPELIGEKKEEEETKEKK